MAKKSKPDHTSKTDLDVVDVPELSEADLRKMRPASEVLPGVVASFKRSRGKQVAPTKQQITLRLDKEVVQHFKQDGAGWQTRINNALRSVVRESVTSGDPMPPSVKGGSLVRKTKASGPKKKRA